MRRITQDRSGVADLVRALHILGADVEQRNARSFDAERDPCIGGAHHGKLDQVARFAFGVGAKVEHHEIIFAQAG